MPEQIEEQPTEEAVEAQQSEEPAAPPEPEGEDKGKTHRTSSYTVLCSTDEGDDPSEFAWQTVGTYETHGNGGQRNARAQALNDPENADLKQAVLEGKTVWFFCVPKQSFQPHAVRLAEPAEPKIVV